MASHGIVHRRTAATIGHMSKLDASALRQERHCEMSDTAAADRAVTHFARIFLGEGEHVGQRLVRLGRSRSDHVGRGADQQHRIEILLAVVRQRRQHERIRGMVVEDREPGVTVGRRFHHRGGADAP